MRTSWFIKFLMIVISIFIGFAAYFVYNFQSINHRPLTKDIEFEVKEGDTLNQILDELSNSGELRNQFFVKFSIKMFNYNTNIKPGTYSFSKEAPLEQLMFELNQGEVSEFVKVTIPEGYSIEAMAEVFNKSDLGISKEEFLDAVKNYPLPDYVKKVDGRRYALEGFLFPDTYHFDKGSTPETIIQIMLKRFEEVFAEIQKELNITVEKDKIDEIVTMASVVEREIIHDDERPKASSVFYNRLKQGMPLQSCATVIYALGKHKEVLYYSDLEVDSKYNTYKYAGLPIGPIAAPGRESLKAAVSPAETNYLYFILNDETNYHYFFENYNDFLKQKQIRDTTLYVKK